MNRLGRWLNWRVTFAFVHLAYWWLRLSGATDEEATAEVALIVRKHLVTKDGSDPWAHMTAGGEPGKEEP